MWNTKPERLPVNIIGLWAKAWYDLQGDEAMKNLERALEKYNTLLSRKEKWERDHQKEKHDLIIEKQDLIHKAVQWRKEAEHNLELSKQRLKVLEAKEDKTKEYLKTIHKLEVENTKLNQLKVDQTTIVKDMAVQIDLLNKRIDKLIDLKITPQQVKVIKGSNSDVKIIK